MTQTTRRSFLRNAALATGAASLTFPRFAIGKPGAAANSKANLAYVGVGGIATGVMQNCRDENHIAMCDVDTDSAAKNYTRYPDVPRYADFRRMLDKHEKEIDGVIISTPDHTHFPIAMDAIERGKHVFVQKPLAHDVWQVRTLLKAARHHKVVTQMGNQGHAGEGIRAMKEWFDAGVLGEVREVHAWMSGQPNRNNPNWRIPDAVPPPPQDVPDTLNWDLWLGPAAARPYADFYCPKNWRTWWDFGNGVLGDFGCHAMDTPAWVLDLGTPTRITPEIKGARHPALVPDASKLVYEFPARGTMPPVILTWYDGGLKPPIVDELKAKGLRCPEGSGMLMIGSKCPMYCTPWSGGPRLLVPMEEYKAFLKNRPPETIPRVRGGPHHEWIRAIKGEGPTPGSNFEVSSKLTELVLLGVAAQRAGVPLEFGGDPLRITNAPEYQPLLKHPVRRDWEYGESYWG